MMQEQVRTHRPTLCLDIGFCQNGVLALPDCAPENWPQLSFPLSADWTLWRDECARRSLPEPMSILVSLESALTEPDWLPYWQAKLDQASGKPFVRTVPAPQDAAVRDLTRRFPAERTQMTYAVTASLFGALCLPGIAARTWRQGIVLLHAGTRRTSALLVFREGVFGIYERPAETAVEHVLRDLKEFKLEWLPDESVRQSGGNGCAFFRPIPEESESFEPIYVSGPQQEKFLGHGMPLSSKLPDLLLRCYGLLSGQSRDRDA